MESCSSALVTGYLGDITIFISLFMGAAPVNNVDVDILFFKMNKFIIF